MPDSTKATATAVEELPAQPAAKPLTSDEQIDAEFAGQDFVLVTHGYGRVPSWEKKRLDDVLFIGGISERAVSLATAKAWKKLPPPMGREIRLHPAEISKAELAKRCGVQTLPTGIMATQIAACDLDAVAEELGPKLLSEVVDRLCQHLPSTDPRRVRARR